MHQTMYTDGFQLIGLRNGQGRVVDRNEAIRFEGKYEAAEKWLADRGCEEASTQNRAYPHQR